MGLGMHGTGPRSVGSTINGNLKGDCKVKQFCTAAGLDVQGFPEYLLSLVAQGHELGSLSNDEWNQILAPMELPRQHVARVHTAISNTRLMAAKEADELQAKRMHNHVVNGGAHPMARPAAEVYEPTLNGARSKNDVTFIPANFFQGEKPGYTFKHGDQGLGYYGAPDSTSSAGRPAPMTNIARGYNPVSQLGLEEYVAATQQRAYTQSRQQQLLSERRQRMEERQSMQHGHSQGQVANLRG